MLLNQDIISRCFLSDKVKNTWSVSLELLFLKLIS